MLFNLEALLLDARIDFAKAERDFIVSLFELAFQLGTLSSPQLNHCKMAIFKAFFILLAKRTKCVHLL